MGTAAVIAASADPLLVAIVSTVLSGGAVGAVASYRRAKGGAQLDMLAAAKVLYDEQHVRLDEFQRLNRELEQQRDALERENGNMAREVARCNGRVDELVVHLEARDDTIRGLQDMIKGLQRRLDELADSR